MEIELLLDRGADASAKNQKGETARDILEYNLSTGFHHLVDREDIERSIKRLHQMEQHTKARAGSETKHSPGQNTGNMLHD